MKSTSTPYGIDIADEYNLRQRVRRRCETAWRVNYYVLCTAACVTIGSMAGRVISYLVDKSLP